MKPNIKKEKEITKRRILLIEPPFYRLFKNEYSLHKFPLSLGYLGNSIRKNTRWDVKVYNSDFNKKNELIKVSYMAGAGFKNYLNSLERHSRGVWDEIKSTIMQYGPDVVGITAKSQNFKSSTIIAKIAKEINEKITIIVGGPHPSMVKKDVLKCPYIDIAVKGEGENTIVELLNAIEKKSALKNVKGIIYRNGMEIVETSQRELIDNLDSLDFPYKNANLLLKDYKEYPLSAFKSIMATRGCPFGCLFCGSRNIWGRVVRFRSPNNIVKEIKFMQNMGLKFFHFDDDNFGVNKRFILELCSAIAKNCPKIRWSCEMHVKLIDEEVVQMMKSAGCYLIQVGIESGNNKILKDIKKEITIEEAINACRIIKKSGLQLETFFMIGFPQETEETLCDTMDLIKKIKCDWIIYSIFTPYPGTDMFDSCKKNGLLDDKYDVSLYNHQSPINYFCKNISKNRFRELASKIEKIVDRRNSLNEVKKQFSMNSIKKIEEMGVSGSLQRIIRIFRDVL